MKKYKVGTEQKDYGYGPSWFTDIIEANSPEEAMQIARRKRTGIETAEIMEE